MRLIYICDRCKNFIDEIEVDVLDEARLGFNNLTGDEKQELLHLDWGRGVGTVTSICDECLSSMSQEMGSVYAYRVH